MLTYLILAHTDPEHLRRLVGRLGTTNRVKIHVDRKAAIEPFCKALRSTHAELIYDRCIVNWAGWSMVEATCSLISYALARGPQNSSHLVLLSGQDYPIKSAREIAEFFESRRGQEVIKWIDVRESPEHYLKSVKLRHYLDRFPVRCEGMRRVLNSVARRVTRFTSNAFPKGLRNDPSSDLAVQCGPLRLHVQRIFRFEGAFTAATSLSVLANVYATAIESNNTPERR